MNALIARHRKLVIVAAAMALLWVNRHSGLTPQEMLAYLDYAIQLLAVVGVYQVPNASKTA